MRSLDSLDLSLGQVQRIKCDTLTVNNVNHFASPDIQKWVISEVIMKCYGLTHASSIPCMLDLLSVVIGTLKNKFQSDFVCVASEHRRGKLDAKEKAVFSFEYLFVYLSRLTLFT